jgi:hypothetical protein
VENDFQTSTAETIYNISQTEIIQLRKAYAEDLLKDKEFIFGRYTVSREGEVRFHSF